jgi:hypothetical protein
MGDRERLRFVFCRIFGRKTRAHRSAKYFCHGATAKPQGLRPTRIDLTTSRASRSITETSPEFPLAL